MKVIRKLRPGDEIPRGFGLAYWSSDACCAVCLPIPFNWLAGWGRSLYFWLVSGPHDPIRKAYSDGYAAGMEAGYGKWSHELLDALRKPK